MRQDLSLVERSVYAVVFAWVHTALLARSPLWDHLVDLGTVLPSRYVTVLAVLPVATNTALAFLLVLAIGILMLFLMRHPVVGLAGLSATSLGMAAYPFGRILWHRIFIRELERVEPAIMDWTLGAAAVVLLMLPALLVQTRSILARYEEKGIEPSQLLPVRRFLVRVGVSRAMYAAAFTVIVGFLAAVLPGQGTAQRFLLDHSVFVLLLAGGLLLAAIGIGSGIFGGAERRDQAVGDAPDGDEP